ncbi:MAG: hypothetical protein KatS3mg031_2949 [Chitinophagales bacterium]|nr:MAG: hypothetical protein KatS3mg031_2949 [Chitinophagales bacterium]
MTAYNLYDRVFSIYIRLKYCEPPNLYAKCFTCGKLHHFTRLQNGHYISRSVAPHLVFDKMNCHPQCVSCNIFKEGNKQEYRLNLIETYGEEAVKNLELRAKMRGGGFNRIGLIHQAKELCEEISRMVGNYNNAGVVVDAIERLKRQMANK